MEIPRPRDRCRSGCACCSGNLDKEPHDRSTPPPISLSSAHAAGSLDPIDSAGRTLSQCERRGSHGTRNRRCSSAVSAAAQRLAGDRAGDRHLGGRARAGDPRRPSPRALRRGQPRDVHGDHRHDPRRHRRGRMGRGCCGRSHRPATTAARAARARRCARDCDDPHRAGARRGVGHRRWDSHPRADRLRVPAIGDRPERGAAGGDQAAVARPGVDRARRSGVCPRGAPRAPCSAPSSPGSSWCRPPP